ncbi:MAG: GntR family transcriptional regulator [bacterium]
MHVRPVSMRHSVVAAIRHALMQGRFQPGEALADVVLAAEMGISRGPVREALLVLAEEGLVVHQQNRGFSVLRFTKEDLRQVQQVRAPLETLALELARGQMGAGQLDELERLTDDLCACVRKSDAVEALRCDREFHQLIWSSTGNPRLFATLRTLTAAYFTYGFAFQLGREDLSEALIERQHRMYVDFLRNRITATARECVAMHITVEPAGGADACQP